MKIQVPLYVEVRECDRWDYEKGEYVKEIGYFAWSMDMSDSGYVMLSKEPFMVDVEIPSTFDPVKAKIDILQDTLKKEMAKSEMKCSALREQINDLQLLGYTPPGKIYGDSEEVPF